VAFFRGRKHLADEKWCGALAQVEMSPFDMSKGWIVSTGEKVL